MGSTQKSTVFQVVKTKKNGSKVAVSAQRGAEVTSTNPQRGHGYILTSSQRSAAVSLSPSQRRPEAPNITTPHSTSDHTRSVSPQPGSSLSAALPTRGAESRSRTEASRHSSPHRKGQQTQTPAVHAYRNTSQFREEVTRRGGESRPARDVSHHASSTPDAKSSRRLSFVDQKDNLQSQILQEEDPPSKVQNPQGVRVPRRISTHPKDEAVQTEPIRRTIGESKSLRNPSRPEHGSSRISADHRTVLKRIPGQEPEIGLHSSIPSEHKSLQRNVNLESSFKLSVLRDLEGLQRVSASSEPESLHKHSAYTEAKAVPKILISSEVESNVRSPIRGDGEVSRRVTISPGRHSVQSAARATVRTVTESPHKSMFVTSEPMYKQQVQKPLESIYIPQGHASRYPEPSRKPSIHAELELTPRPLPPRSLPRYGPGSSWWALLNPEIEMPQSRPTTPDFEPESPPPLDPLSSLFEVDSSPFCKDLMFQREKASPSPPATPKESLSQALLREVPQASKHTCKQPIQRFSAFFLDVSEEMQNRVIWWLKDEEIKRFLEDTTDDAELSKFVKDFPGSESCHPPEAKTWVPRPQAPDVCDDDLEFRPPSWPQSSDSQQYFCAPAPLSPSARPRSPWGKLDPYDSSEDDKEYVGFATLPNQVHRKSVKKGFDFTLMVAGESGLGKSTLVNSLFLTDLYRDRKLLSAEERIMQTVEITKHAVDIEEKGVRLRLTIVDTPGFGDAVNNTECNILGATKSS
ncbi:septin-4 isoform X2 [Tupaia chinensis]|uniref:septin-4 isoform X2 n=1 Tax=Tupaia chinensis TaxID=246437 RepID=UPI0003C8EA48|nr:septin-4 isoform X2 [Tupaia chinensis]